MLKRGTIVLLAAFLCLQSALSMAQISKQTFSLPGSAAGYSSPLVDDIDNNPANGLEIVKATSDGSIHALSATGQLLWSSSIPQANCVGAIGNRLHSSPALGVLDRSGNKAIVVGFGAVISRSCDGGILALNASNGEQLWFFSLRDFAKKNKFYAFRYSVFSTPALADVNKDGLMEIGFGSFDRNLYLLNPNGTVRWYYNAADTVWSSPAFVDINADSKPEMIAATDISANKRMKPPTPDGGYLYALKTDPVKTKKIGFRDGSKAYWRSETDQVLFSSPISADVISSNPGKEIIIASGCFFPQNNNNKRGKWIKIFSQQNGKLLRTLETPACSSGSPAVGDINDDGQLEIVALIQGASRNGGSGQSFAIAFDAENNRELWRTVPRAADNNQELAGEFSSPVIADLDGNGSLEVIINNSNGLVVLQGQTGAALTCETKSCGDKPSLLFNASSSSTPDVADINNDGALELIAAASNGIHIWSSFAGQLNSQTGGQTAFSAPWPTWRGDSSRTGNF